MSFHWKLILSITILITIFDQFAPSNACISWTQICECGCTDEIKDSEDEFKISNGDLVRSDTKWPWAVSLVSIIGGCTATLVSPRHVLTAAHCFLTVDERENVHKKVLVRLGSHNHSSPATIRPKVESVLVHPGYSHKTIDYENDLAIIKLAEPLKFSANVRPICLAKEEFNDSAENLPANHASAYIIGWGHMNPADYDDAGDIVSREPDQHPELLREGHAQVDERDECERLLGDLPEGHLCMEIGHQNAETGDSGGPLLKWSADGKTWTQIGVTSISRVIEGDRVAILYTRISEYCDWIEQITEGEVKCR